MPQVAISDSDTAEAKLICNPAYAVGFESGDKTNRSLHILIDL